MEFYLMAERRGSVVQGGVDLTGLRVEHAGSPRRSRSSRAAVRSSGAAVRSSGATT
jgi:hypothetical protein